MFWRNWPSLWANPLSPCFSIPGALAANNGGGSRVTLPHPSSHLRDSSINGGSTHGDVNNWPQNCPLISTSLQACSASVFQLVTDWMRDGTSCGHVKGALIVQRRRILLAEAKQKISVRHHRTDNKFFGVDYKPTLFPNTSHQSIEPSSMLQRTAPTKDSIWCWAMQGDWQEDSEFWDLSSCWKNCRTLEKQLRFEEESEEGVNK